jgi:pyruvate formate lyase activating enzyme
VITEARHWETIDGRKIVCTLCPAECKLTEGKIGICGARFNRRGKLVTDNYGETVSIAIDPIEKKPLYHFYPGSKILSTGANGCNFACANCQNWSIAQEKTHTSYIAPEQLANLAAEHDSVGIAFTYTEPMIWFEYIMDTAPLLADKGLKTVLVSNGYINPTPLAELIDHIDAINVDLKSMRPDFYKRVCKGKLEPVLETIRTLAHSSVHLELTTLLIPGLNDSDEELQDLIDFVAGLNPRIPLHFSAFHPDHKMRDRERTPEDLLLHARQLAREKLDYVFLGNVALEAMADTRCPNCGNVLIVRDWYRTRVIGLDNDRCRQCSHETGITGCGQKTPL